MHLLLEGEQEKAAAADERTFVGGDSVSDDWSSQRRDMLSKLKNSSSNYQQSQELLELRITAT